MRILIVGYGNLTRSDDGAGIELAERFQKDEKAGIHVYSSQQLQIEFAAELDGYDQVVFVDAAQGGPEIFLESITLDFGTGLSSSHYLAPEMILKLAKKIYGYAPEAWMCRIRGENFEFGTALSSEVVRRVDKAEGMIRSLISEEVGRA